MSSLDQFFSGGKLPPFKNYRVLQASADYVTSVKGKLYVLAVAGGGSGALNRTTTGAPTGGGAGEIAFDVIPVTPGMTFSATIGAGGVARTQSSGTSLQAGADGGNTSVTGPSSYSLTVVGGKGGKAPTSGASTGGDGGTGGTGGTAKARFFPGGNGGPVTNAASNTSTGGGAVNFLGLSQSTVTAGSNSNGGAGIGGTSNGNNGGGSGGPATAGASGQANVLSGQTFLQQESFWKVPVFGSGASGSGTGGDGGGGGRAGNGGFFGGGGGTTDTNNVPVTAGSGGTGAGGGGTNATQGIPATSGAGGAGLVIFIEVEDV